MNKYILWFIFFIYTTISFGQAIGSWKAYPALQISTYNIPVGHKVYSLQLQHRRYGSLRVR